MTVVSDELIEEIRAQADILQIIGEFMSLRRVGRTYRGPCPLHGGEGPNFSVYPERGIFKCFVCGEGGDVFSFPMKLLGLDFVEAVKFVAERCGIVVPDIDRTESEEDPYRDIREAVALAADWYQRQLWEEKHGESARRYLLVQRGLPEEMARRFGFGYAPDSWRALREAAAVHEVADDVLIRAGLVKASERAKEPYDLFRGRLMIPIFNLRDRPIGFGGRSLTESEDTPKYINSPDTPIFHKGRIVYGLNWSRNAIRRDGVVLVVEGYMDLVLLLACGVENVVAPLGTSLTEYQARTLGRYAKKALLLYDSDRPGLVATFKAADELLQAGVQPSVATLPPGEDPDSIARKGGPEALAKYTDAAIDVLDRKIQILQKRGYLETSEGKRRAVDGLLLTVRATADEALRDIYLDRVAAVTGVRRATLERELERPVGGTRRRGRALLREAEVPREAPRLGAERKLLLLLVRDRSLVARVADQIESDDFKTPEYREIYRALTAAAAATPEQAAADSLAWADELPAHLFEQVQELAADPEDLTNPEAVLQDAIARLRARALEKRLSDLMTEVLVADTDAAVELASEIRNIRQELTALGYRMPGRGLFRGA
ncbi:MAG: DNA primase [Gemmatimonadota bacterium]|nr:MAG: DNA primase [Gemmatimonadota bacterium]